MNKIKWKNKNMCFLIGTMTLVVAIATAPTSLADVDYSIFDMNDDCVIDGQDVELVEIYFGWTGSPGAVREDINKDGRVDITDISMLNQYLGISYDCGCQDEEPDPEQDEEPEPEPEPEVKEKPSKKSSPKQPVEKPKEEPINESNETAENESNEINETEQPEQNNTHGRRSGLIHLLTRLYERNKNFGKSNSQLARLLEWILNLYNSGQGIQ